MSDEELTQTGGPAEQSSTGGEALVFTQVRDSLARFESLWARGSDLVLVCDADLTIRYVGPALSELFGYSPEDVVGTDGMAFVHADDATRFLTLWRLVASSPTTHERVDLRVRHRDGTWLWVEARITNLLNDPDVAGLVLNVRDITDRQLATQALAASEKFHRSILEMTREGIWVTDATGRTRFANARMAEMLGVDVDTLSSSRVLDLFDETTATELARRRRRRAQGVHEDYYLPFTDNRGDERWFQISAAPVTGPDGAYDGAIAVVSDVTDRKRVEDALEVLSLYDAMTGLPNRSLLSDRLRELTALRELRGQDFSLLVIDIDRLAGVNDEHGLAVGDSVIVEIGRRISGSVRDGDTVARSSGDEFVVLCPGADSYAAGRIAEALCAAVSEPLQVGNAVLAVTVSVGVADSRTVAPEQLAAVAATAVAEAKTRGRARVVLHDPAMVVVRADRLQLLRDLRAGIADGAVEVWYQPIMELGSDEVSGVEALLRWTHPTRGPISPATFIPLAEESGVIDELGAFALTAACAEAVRWPERNGRELSVSVNLSARQLNDPKITDKIVEALRASALPPSRLTLEVTETAVLGDLDVALQTLNELRGMGIRVALDDFGTGFSSLTYLRQFPVNAIKIDRSFVSGLGTNADDTAIVASLISLAAAVGVHVVAEGVETAEQRDRLRALGCRFGQGFLWSPAVPAARLRTTMDEIARGGPSGPPRRRRPAMETDSTTAGRILAMHQCGASLSTIAAALNADGLVTTTGSRWHRQSVARLIAAEGDRASAH
jgi:diguanylate cyclase (GGDEF)-like protein/PAS domain S-box-containing protein